VIRTLSRVDAGDLVLLTEDSFECLEEDCSELRGYLGEVLHISSVLEGSELTILFTQPKKMILTQVPQGFVTHVAQA
jgi:hypothetical protein